MRGFLKPKKQTKEKISFTGHELMESCKRSPQNLNRIQDLVESCPEAVCYSDSDGRLPLHIACSHQPPAEVIRFLIDCASDTTRQATKKGLLPLHYACREQAPLDVIQLLIKKCPNSIKQRTNSGWLPLHLASARSTNLAAISYLLQQWPASAHQPTQDGRLALHFACANRAPKTVVETLVQSFPPAMKHKDDNQWTPLHIACAYSQSFDVIQYLVREWRDGLKETGRKGRLPLHLACLDRRPQLILEYLIQQYQPALRVADDDGKLPFHSAVSAGAPMVLVRILAQHYPEALLGLGRTPTEIATTLSREPTPSFELTNWVENMLATVDPRSHQLEQHIGTMQTSYRTTNDSLSSISVVPGSELLSRSTRSTRSDEDIRNSSRRSNHTLFEQDPLQMIPLATLGMPSANSTRPGAVSVNEAAIHPNSTLYRTITGTSRPSPQTEPQILNPGAATGIQGMTAPSPVAQNDQGQNVSSSRSTGSERGAIESNSAASLRNSNSPATRSVPPQHQVASGDRTVSLDPRRNALASPIYPNDSPPGINDVTAHLAPTQFSTRATNSVGAPGRNQNIQIATEIGPKTAKEIKSPGRKLLPRLPGRRREARQPSPKRKPAPHIESQLGDGQASSARANDRELSPPSRSNSQEQILLASPTAYDGSKPKRKIGLKSPLRRIFTTSDKSSAKSKAPEDQAVGDDSGKGSKSTMRRIFSTGDKINKPSAVEKTSRAVSDEGWPPSTIESPNAERRSFSNLEAPLLFVPPTFQANVDGPLPNIVVEPCPIRQTSSSGDRANHEQIASSRVDPREEQQQSISHPDTAVFRPAEGDKQSSFYRAAISESERLHDSAVKNMDVLAGSHRSQDALAGSHRSQNALSTSSRSQDRLNVSSRSRRNQPIGRSAPVQRSHDVSSAKKPSLKRPPILKQPPTLQQPPTLKQPPVTEPPVVKSLSSFYREAINATAETSSHSSRASPTKQTRFIEHDVSRPAESHTDDQKPAASESPRREPIAAHLSEGDPMAGPAKIHQYSSFYRDAIEASLENHSSLDEEAPPAAPSRGRGHSSFYREAMRATDALVETVKTQQQSDTGIQPDEKVLKPSGDAVHHIE